MDVPVGTGEATTDEAFPDTALMGWWLLDRAGVDVDRQFWPVPGGAATAEGEQGPAGPVDIAAESDPGALVMVVADGPAALDPRAPIPLDGRAVDHDRALRGWIVGGGRLPDTGESVAEEIGWWSRPVWRALARLLGGAAEAQPGVSPATVVGPAPAAVESISWAPFGVGYHAARWQVPR